MFKKNIQIEICSYSLESAINAQKAGANRIELCNGIFEGGTTPSFGLIKETRKSIDIDIFVMVRPRGGDFLYDESEFKVIKAEIEILKTLNIQGIVVGFLKRNGEVDQIKLKQIVKLAHPLKVVFHRAIDLTPDPKQALNTIIDSGCIRILTSGQKNKAIDGIDVIKELILKANGKIEIMVGAGINEINAQKLLNLNIDALHLSGSSFRESKMTFKNQTITMSSINENSENSIQFSDYGKIKAIIEKIKPQN